MKTFIEGIKKGLGHGLGFFLILGIGGIIYAAVGNTWTSPDSLQVGVGSGLTMTSWNQMLANMNYLNSKPLFSAYLNQVSSAPINIWTKIPFNTVEFDTNNFFNTSTNRFQPNIAGYYRIDLFVTGGGTAAGGSTIMSTIYKNGSHIKQSQSLINYAGSFRQVNNISTVLYMNGSTDYIEGWYLWNGGTVGLTQGLAYTYMQGEYLRP